jgi:hypothetical protein
MFFWVFPRRQYVPTFRNRVSVPSSYWRRGNTQKNIYNIQITAKAWNLHYKDYFKIFAKVIERAKRFEYDKQILKSYNGIKTTWEIINTESGRNIKNVEYSN